MLFIIAAAAAVFVVQMVPSLVDLCIKKWRDNVWSLGGVGELDDYLLEKMLPLCSVDQLKYVEACTKVSHGRDLSSVTDKYWKTFYEARFDNSCEVIEKMIKHNVSFKWSKAYEYKEEETKAQEEMRKLVIEYKNDHNRDHYYGSSSMAWTSRWIKEERHYLDRREEEEEEEEGDYHYYNNNNHNYDDVDEEEKEVYYHCNNNEEKNHNYDDVEEEDDEIEVEEDFVERVGGGQVFDEEAEEEQPQTLESEEEEEEENDHDYDDGDGDGDGDDQYHYYNNGYDEEGEKEEIFERTGREVFVEEIEEVVNEEEQTQVEEDDRGMSEVGQEDGCGDNYHYDGGYGHGCACDDVYDDDCGYDDGYGDDYGYDDGF